MRSDESLQPREAEHLPPRVVSLYQPIAVEEDALSRLQRYLLLLVAHVGHQAQRHPPGPESANTVGVAHIRWVVSGIGVVQPTTPAIQEGGQTGNEHIGRNIPVKNIVDLFEYLPRRRRAHTVGRTQHRAGDRHHDGSRHTLAANVPYNQSQTTIRQIEEVVEVAAHLTGRLVVDRDLMPFELGQRLWQKGVLDQASDPQLLFDTLPLLGLLLLLGHGALELLGTLCNPPFEVLVEVPDLFFFLFHL